jgi:muconolactone D-isomerase
MEFLVEFDVNVPDGAPESEVKDREGAEAFAARTLAEEGHLVRIWTREGKVLGLYRADSRSELDRLLRTLPLYDWMQVAVTPLETHPNDPAAQMIASHQRSVGND